MTTSVTIKYTKVSAGAYNASGGASPTTTAEYSLPAILEEYRQQEIDNYWVLPEDRKLIFCQVDLPATPTLSDTVTVGGNLCDVLDVRAGRVPGAGRAGATWVLQVRRQ